MSRGSQRAAKNACDILFSKYIRTHGRCENCGKTEGQVQLQCAHWISRKYSNTRVDPDNAFCLCAGCHLHFTLNPTEFGRWAIRTTGKKNIDKPHPLGIPEDEHADYVGEQIYQRLREAANSGRKVDWTEQREVLKKMLEKVQA